MNLGDGDEENQTIYGGGMSSKPNDADHVTNAQQ
jgi:hypothetical protein